MDQFFSILDSVLRSEESEHSRTKNILLAEYREQASARYHALAVPNPKDKNWAKLANLALPAGSFQPPVEPRILSAQPAELQDDLAGMIEISENEIRFKLTDFCRESGVVACDLQTAAKDHSKLFEKSQTTALLNKSNKVAAFTNGASRHGFLLFIPRMLKIKKPIEIRWKLNRANSVLPATCLIVLDEQASATVINRQESDITGGGAIATSSWNLHLGDSAALRVLEMQNYGKNIWNFSNQQIVLGKDALLEHLLLDKGSAVLQRNLSVTLQKDGGKAEITGIYTPQAGQHFVIDTFQNHLASDTTSDLLFGGVLKDDAFSLWKGNIYVSEGTKGTDGFQRNKNLLLSEAAHAEAIPGLEIIADDVRCSHAVTLSSVDAEQLFFLRSRGISEKEAQDLIVSGFLESAATRIRDQELKERILEALN